MARSQAWRNAVLGHRAASIPEGPNQCPVARSTSQAAVFQKRGLSGVGIRENIIRSTCTHPAWGALEFPDMPPVMWNPTALFYYGSCSTRTGELAAGSSLH